MAPCVSRSIGDLGFAEQAYPCCIILTFVTKICSRITQLNLQRSSRPLVVPVIREVPKVVTISKKKTVVIECKVMSMYEPTVTWMKEKSTVKEDNKHIVHVEQVKDVSMSLANGTTLKRKQLGITVNVDDTS